MAGKANWMEPYAFRKGVSDVEAGTFFSTFGQFSPLKHHIYLNDFHTYTAGDWTITTTEDGGNSATEALADDAFGVLLVTCDVGDNDNDFFQKVGESFQFVAGKELWFASRFKVAEATQCDFVVGLQITDTSPLAVSDGVYFRKDDGDALLDFVVMKNGTPTTATGIHTVVDDTYLTVAFYYNGVDAIEYWVDDVQLGSSVVTNMPDDELLTISFGIQTGEITNVKTMSMDLIFAAVER